MEVDLEAFMQPAASNAQGHISPEIIHATICIQPLLQKAMLPWE